MKYWLGLPLCLLFGVVAYLFPEGRFLIKVSEKLPILLSVVLAAIFVRLARGFPAIPYDKIKASQALIATQAFRHLVRSYLITLMVLIVAIAINILASTIIIDAQEVFLLRWLSVALAITDSFVLLSIGVLVSSDVKIATIQADLIDEVTGALSTKSAKGTKATVKDAFKVTDGSQSSVKKL